MRGRLMSPQSVLIVDDHPPLRAGIAAILGRSGPYEVIGEAGSVADAERLARLHSPGVAIVDVSLPDGTGIALVRTLKGECGVERVLVVSMHARRAFAERSLAAGADGYLLKESSGEHLIRALDAIAGGERFIDAVLLPLDGSSGSIGTAPKLEPLSAREREVFGLLAAGSNSKEIGFALGISPKTVDNHRSSIMEKLALENLADLVRLAVRTGVIDP